MVSKRRKMRNRWISIGLFSTFSLVLFINNFTDVMGKFGVYMPIQWVSWVGLALTLIYTIWMASEDKI
jgi:putative Ca2+/H+ antiporter (TMEM165/GDT1 family)